MEASVGRDPWPIWVLWAGMVLAAVMTVVTLVTPIHVSYGAGAINCGTFLRVATTSRSVVAAGAGNEIDRDCVTAIGAEWLPVALISVTFYLMTAPLGMLAWRWPIAKPLVGLVVFPAWFLGFLFLVAVNAVGDYAPPR
jgi:hypothetical protein